MELKAKNIRLQADFQRCAEFHGHVCPGLSIGYKATKAAMRFLEQHQPAQDEELVAIVETDACGSDAVQVLTGCTFGKGNFLYKDNGKMAFTLMDRKTGKGVRVCTKKSPLESNSRHGELMQKVMRGQASDAEKAEFQALHEQRGDAILETADEVLFDMQAVQQELPPKAHMEPSKPCEQCQEPVMGCKLKSHQGSMLCNTCYAQQT